MKAKRGQVALYLIMVLVGVMVLALMNVDIFLSVRSKNRAMNAGDAAALAVARYQGELLNEMGNLNIEHLKAALDDDAPKCLELMARKARLAFLDPLHGIVVGNEAAKRNGVTEDDAMTQILREHAIEVRTVYASNPDIYPEPWEGAWDEYATALEVAIGGGVVAGPDNVEFVGMISGHFLLMKSFYEAVASRNWCWFHFNGNGLLSGYSGGWPPLPFLDEEARRRRSCNSEIYSLHLDKRQGSAVECFGTNLICRLTGATSERLEKSRLIHDQAQIWYVYDEEMWRTWWEIDPDGEWEFPVVGRVKEEYDVRGCAALCRVRLEDVEWVAAAKPFGTVENEKGDVDVAPALKRLVTPAFTDSRMTPLDVVGGNELSTADADWVHHVKKHLPSYLEHGTQGLMPGCFWCDQLRTFEKPSFRQQGVTWLKFNASSCIRPCGSGGSHGGSAHGH